MRPRPPGIPEFLSSEATPEERRAYIRAASLELQREDKERVAPPGAVDLGIVLTPDEEKELREYAQRMQVDLDEVIEYNAATYTIVDEAPAGLKTGDQLADARIVPREHLLLRLKCSIATSASNREWLSHRDAQRN